MTSISAALQQNNCFLHLSTEEINQVANISKWVAFPSESIVFSESQPSHAFYILLKGRVKMIFDSKKIVEVHPNEVFGDWAVLNDTVRLATAKTINPIEVVAVDAIKFKDPEFLPRETFIKIILQLTKIIIQRLQSQSQVASKILIELGETETVEFKSSIRKNLHTNQKDKAMELAIIKTIAGFLNQSGGVLFIGINDQGEVLGLDHDDFQNDDKLLLHLGHILHDKIGESAAANVLYSIVKIADQQVVRVDCSRAQSPVFVEDGQHQYFYVRNGVQTISYNIKEAVNYIKSHY